MKQAVFDIEGDGLLDTITKTWCIVIYDVGENKVLKFRPDNIAEGVEILSKYDCLIGHNIVHYDIPAIHKLTGVRLEPSLIYDTLILSKLLNPDREGGHSLESWGNRLGDHKISFNDFSQFSEDMLTYCVQDVKLNFRVYNEILKEAGDWDWSDSYRRELRVAQIVHTQEMHGVLFDKELAERCLEELISYMQDIESKVEPLLPNKRIPNSRLKYPPKRRFKKDGSPSALAERFFGDRLKKVIDFGEGGWDRWFVTHPNGQEVPLEEANAPLATYEPMSLSNQSDLKEWLQSLGWEPTVWNVRVDKATGQRKRTSPKFTDQQKNICPNLLKLGGKVDFIRDVVLWLSYRSRKNVIKSDNGTGWLHNPRLEVDGRLSASADTIGTNTGRFAHRVVANIPRVSSIYGHEMRSLFTVSEGKYLVGWDASGLEARIEGHYTSRYDEGEYARELLEGDVHQNNADAFGCDRDTAKPVKYALSYGARGPKVAATLGVSKEEGERLFNAFWDKNWSLRELRDNLHRYWVAKDKKFILGLDGRKVMTRSAHSLINTLFQSGGIICMKEAMILWYDWVKDEGLDAHQVIHYHDEAQAEVDGNLIEFKVYNTIEEAKAFTDDRIWSGIIEEGDKIYRGYSRAGELGVLSIREAGKRLGLSVPLDAEYCIGRTWAQTH